MKIVPKWVAAMGDSCFQTDGSFQFYDGHLCFYVCDTANIFQKDGCPQLPRPTEENYPNRGAVNQKNIGLWKSGLLKEPDLGYMRHLVEKTEEPTSPFYSDAVCPNEGKELLALDDLSVAGEKYGTSQSMNEGRKRLVLGELVGSEVAKALLYSESSAVTLEQPKH